MTAEELWARSGLSGTYEAWSFGGAPDELAKLVNDGIKTATCSALDCYVFEDDPLPEAGEYSVILNGKDEAVCIIRTTLVYRTRYCDVTALHAYREGEGDRSLAHWRQVHRAFFEEELAAIGKRFSETMMLVCEEFEKVYP